MEKFLLQSARIVGTPTETSGSWVHIFSPSELEKIAKRGHLLTVIGLVNFSGPSEITGVGREIISRLHEEYYGDLIESAFNQLRKSVQKVAEEAKGGMGFELEIGAVVVVKDILYGVIYQGGRLVIARDGKVTPLLTGEGPISGYCQEDDIFLLGTTAFFKTIDEQTIQGTLPGVSPDEAVEIFAPLTHGQEDGAAAAVVFKMLKKMQPPKPIPSTTLLPPNQNQLFIVARKLKIQLAAFWDMVGEKLRKRVIYLKSQKEKTPRSQKTLVSVALILLVLLGASVFFGMRQRRNLGLSQQAKVMLEQARTKVQEAQALATLNPAKSRQLLMEASGVVSQIEKEGSKSSEFREFKQQLEQLLSSVLREHQVEGTLFFDLEIIKAGAVGESLVVSGEQLIVLDKNQATVYGLGIKDKKSSILAGGEKLADAGLLAESGGKIYVLGSQGIVKADKNPAVVIKKDEEWGEIADFAAFTGNLYLLDKSGEIWKYLGIEEGFGVKQRWLKEKVDLSGAVSLTIDGAIWVLRADGEILKFTQGAKDTFRISGLNKPFSGPVALYTDFNLKNLYVLDKGNSRVVVLKKSGEYDSEYIWEGIGQASDLAVLEEEKKIFLLQGSKIYKLDKLD